MGRWLTATPSLEDVLINAIALEFVLLLKELLYHTLVSSRNKRELANTKIRPHDAVSHGSCTAFFSGILWGCIALGWVLYYIFSFQMVLQEYNWDVRGVCKDYMAASHD